MSDSSLKFPDGFLWGAATSHFQVEGHPKEIASRLSDWALWTNEAGRISDSTSADQACQFYHRYEDDIVLIRDMNLNAFRLSFNWPALLQDPPGTRAGPSLLDQKQVDYYRRILTSLKESGVTTFATLFHFTLPDWLAAAGGWTTAYAVSEFKRFSELIVAEFSELVDYWITINEPLAYVYQSYVAGLWPPGIKSDYLSAFKAVRRLLEGHAAAYDAIKAVKPDAQVSYTLHWRPFMPKNPLNPLDHMVRFYRDFTFNQLFSSSLESGEVKFPFPINLNKEIISISGPVEGLKGKCDYLAINYYTRELSRFRPSWPIDIFGESSPERELAVNDIGWEVYPQGLYDLLTGDTLAYQFNLDGSRRPVIITENGYASSFAADLDQGDWSLADQKRVDYLLTHLREIHRAIAAGVDVRGYLHWSLLDNFEWAEGLKARFGLIRVSYPTQERILRASAKVYAEIAKNNAI
ncbi:family 1 glycosylhydrolase [bacterium]|nr:family 1 glycosylhydrolase [bacterium]MBP9809630.1 family 1 glycosylhydrolase [bacterium]